MAFFTHEFLQFMCESDQLLIDGTFKAAPKIFRQVVTIHFVRKGKVFPAVYAFLPNKEEQTYIRLLQLLREHALMFNLILNPEIFLGDFEIAIVNAIKAVFPLSRFRGCLFHLNSHSDY